MNLSESKRIFNEKQSEARRIFVKKQENLRESKRIFDEKQSEAKIIFVEKQRESNRIFVPLRESKESLMRSKENQIESL